MTPQIEKELQDERNSQRKSVFDHDMVTVIFVLGGPGAGV